jgi:hypothetical protein
MLRPSTGWSDVVVDPRRDYFVVTQTYGRTLISWKWEIRRRSKPLGVRLCDGDYKTEQAAKLAGEKALNAFLEALTRELAAEHEPDNRPVDLAKPDTVNPA